MKLEKNLVREIAKTARLELSEEEISNIEKDMDEVLNAFAKIQEVSTENVEMSIQPVPISDSLREDEPSTCLTQEEALSQTKHKKDGFFTGPRAV